MKKILIITGVMLAGVVMVSCNRNGDKAPGRAYMPDMSYSRAYETYSSTEELSKAGISYNARPVEGTIARGDAFPYTLKNDSSGYIQSAATKNPLDIASIDMKEAERLYLVNCGICHGAKLDGNGPLFNGGDGPYPSAPKNLLSDELKAMTEGTMFHSVTFGKNAMGSYASQMSTKQRWEVIAYIKSKQGGTAAAQPAKVDSVAVVK